MDIEQEITGLRARIEMLERRDARLGPRPETQESINRRTQQLVDAVAKAKHEHETDPEGRQICTTSGEAPSVTRSKQRQEGSAGQHSSYIVLCEEERAKGFVRPYRDAYKHLACGSVTTMGRSLSETYARDPAFYGSTFCVTCNRHFPVADFTWTADGEPVGA